MRWSKGNPIYARIIPYEVVPGADVDIAIAEKGQKFEQIVRAHFDVIKMCFPSATLVRVERGRSGIMYRVVSAKAPGIEKGFRVVEMYPASWAHICAQHMGMVRLAYTAAHADEPGALPTKNVPKFFLTASCLKSAIPRSTPNYYYFATKKTTPQEILLKYAARGYHRIASRRTSNMRSACMPAKPSAGTLPTALSTRGTSSACPPRRKLQCRELHGRNPRLRIRRRSQPGHGDRADRRIGSARRRRTTQYIYFYRSAGHLTRTLPQGVTSPTGCFQLVASSPYTRAGGWLADQLHFAPPHGLVRAYIRQFCMYVATYITVADSLCGRGVPLCRGLSRCKDKLLRGPLAVSKSARASTRIMMMIKMTDGFFRNQKKRHGRSCTQKENLKSQKKIDRRYFQRPPTAVGQTCSMPLESQVRSKHPLYIYATRLQNRNTIIMIWSTI